MHAAFGCTADLIFHSFFQATPCAVHVDAFFSCRYLLKGSFRKIDILKIRKKFGNVITVLRNC